VLRRDFVRTAVLVGVAPRAFFGQQAANPAPPPPAPVPWTLGLNPRTPLPIVETADGIAVPEATFFSSAQMATLNRLCDLLLPPLGGKPGATEAGTPVFLDYLIGSSPEARKTLYRGGLDWLDAAARSKHRLPFAKLDAAQADSLVGPWLRTWMSDHPPTETHAEFINIAHEDIRTATVNSKQWDDASAAAGQDWVTGGLYWSPIEPEITHPHGMPVHVEAASKAAQGMPSYPR
jgi:Gluconate 2-dehydrogenase subunit 3